jgi:hypothetical protein
MMTVMMMMPSLAPLPSPASSLAPGPPTPGPPTPGLSKPAQGSGAPCCYCCCVVVDVVVVVGAVFVVVAAVFLFLFKRRSCSRCPDREAAPFWICCCFLFGLDGECSQ